MEVQTAEESEPDMSIYLVTGEVRGIELEAKTVIVRHEEIPDYMAAMTMPFDVKDVSEISGLETNDLISFRMIVTEDDGWIDQVKKIGKAKPQPKVVVPAVRIVPDVEPLEVGSAMSDYSFTNELGEEVRISDYRGKALAITFIFTRCPFPDFCPRMAAQFSAVQDAFKEGPEDWQLLSITIDPEYDTPDVLQAYAKRYNYDPGHWSWVTGEIGVIDAITTQFGLNMARVGGTIEHNLRTVVVDPAGDVQEILIGNYWSAEDLLVEMRKAMGVDVTTTE